MNAITDIFIINCKQISHIIWVHLRRALEFHFLIQIVNNGSSSLEVVWKKVLLKIWQNAQENTCARDSEMQAGDLSKNVTLAQVFFCEFCYFLKNNFFTDTFLQNSSRWLPLNEGLRGKCLFKLAANIQ